MCDQELSWGGGRPWARVGPVLSASLMATCGDGSFSGTFTLLQASGDTSYITLAVKRFGVQAGCQAGTQGSGYEPNRTVSSTTSSRRLISGPGTLQGLFLRHTSAEDMGARSHSRAGHDQGHAVSQHPSRVCLQAYAPKHGVANQPSG